MSTGLILVGALAFLVSPDFRHQVALSTTRQPDHFVAAYYTDPDAARQCPTSAGGTRAAVDVTVVSTLAEPASMPYAITVRTTGQTTVVRGTVDVPAGRRATVRRAVDIPSAGGRTSDETASTGSYATTFDLVGRPTKLQVRCPDEDSSR